MSTSVSMVFFLLCSEIFNASESELIMACEVSVNLESIGPGNPKEYWDLVFRVQVNCASSYGDFVYVIEVGPPDGRMIIERRSNRWEPGESSKNFIWTEIYKASPSEHVEFVDVKEGRCTCV